MGFVNLLSIYKLVGLGAVSYVVWNVLKFIILYYHHCVVSRKVTPYGPVRMIWGNMDSKITPSIVYMGIRDVVKEKKAKVISFWRMFFEPIYFTTHPDTAKLLMKSSYPKLTKFGQGYGIITPWIGFGLLTSEGRKWERNRRLLTPAFHFDVLRPYVKIYNENSSKFINKLRMSTISNASVEIFEPAGLVTLDTMLRCAFSYNGDVQKHGAAHPYAYAVKRLAHAAMWRAMRPWYNSYWLFKLTKLGKEFAKHVEYVHQFAEEIISKRKVDIANSKVPQKRYLDFLDILLTAKDENGQGLTDLEIRDEVDTFLFEGHDTTSSGISWSIYCLGKYPEEQEKAFREIQGILKDKDEFEWADLQNMPVLTAFIKEVMRLYPPVPGVSRVLTEDVTIDGVRFKKGMYVVINVRHIHRNPHVWPESDTFIPDRFIGTDKTRDVYSFVPFSAGPRNCIGQHFAMDEMKVVLGSVIHNFRVLPAADHDPIPTPELTLRSKNGIKVVLQSR